LAAGSRRHPLRSSADDLGVDTEARALGDDDVLVDDGVLYDGSPTDVHAVQQDAARHLGARVDADPGRQDRLA